MAGPGEILGCPWPPFVIRPCRLVQSNWNDRFVSTNLSNLTTWPICFHELVLKTIGHHGLADNQDHVEGQEFWILSQGIDRNLPWSEVCKFNGQIKVSILTIPRYSGTQVPRYSYFPCPTSTYPLFGRLAELEVSARRVNIKVDHEFVSSEM